MNEEAFYRQLEELLEVDAGTITAPSVLRDLEGWNSMAVISLMAMVDEQYGVALPPKGIAACTTAGDLARLVEGQGAQASAK